MKIKNILILLILVLFTGCSYSYKEKAVDKRYIKLSNKLDNLMDDEIEESERAKLEEQYAEFVSGMTEYKAENPKKDTKYLDKYIEASKRKLGYLKDIKD